MADGGGVCVCVCMGGGLWLQSRLCESSMPRIAPNSAGEMPKSSLEISTLGARTQGEEQYVLTAAHPRWGGVRHADIPPASYSSSSSILQRCSCQEPCSRHVSQDTEDVMLYFHTLCVAGFSSSVNDDFLLLRLFLSLHSQGDKLSLHQVWVAFIEMITTSRESEEGELKGLERKNRELTKKERS